MTLLKSKTKRLNRLNAAWWINDWSARFREKKDLKTIKIPDDYPSNIIVKSNTDSIEMTQTKYFLSESLKSSKGMNGTIIIGTASSSAVSELHEILLNIQPHGWIYIPGGRKNEN